MCASDVAEIRKQAELLARENKRAEPGITEILWFPSANEVHLVEVESSTVQTLSGNIEPFYFPPAPTDGLPAPSGIAIIRPDEVGKLTLPPQWGTWDEAVRLEITE